MTDDIVILRLCPTSSCSSDKDYGCTYNFSEYAIELSDYVRIMLRYQMAYIFFMKKDNTNKTEEMVIYKIQIWYVYSEKKSKN